MANALFKLSANFRNRIIKSAGLRLADAAGRDTTTYYEMMTGTGVPSGAYHLATGNAAVYFREDAADIATSVYYTVDGGTTWATSASVFASTAGAGLIGILDALGIITATDVEGALAENRQAIDVLEAVERPWPISALGPWAIDGDAAATNGAGLVGVAPALVPVAPDNAFCFDFTNSEYNLLSVTSGGTDYTADFQIFSDTFADGDAFYVGNSVPFCEIATDVTATVGVYGGAAITPEYWNGAAWVTLTLAIDNTGTTGTTGTTYAERDGATSFVPPADWASTTVDAFTGFLVRFRVTTTANVTTPAVLADEPSLVTPDLDSAILTPASATITALHLASAFITPGTANDTKFILMNYTTGQHSGELTWPQDTRAYNWSALALAVNAFDTLGFMVTAEDGTNEHLNVVGSVNVSI